MEATEGRELEIHREVHSISIALDNLADEFNKLEAQLSSVIQNLKDCLEV